MSIPMNILPRSTTTTTYHHRDWADEKRESSKREARIYSSSILLGSLLLGIVLAVGHDRFYRSLDGKSIRSVGISQQWVSRVGTGLAFLVKASLVNAIVLAYTQRLWRKMRTYAFKVGNIDHLMAAPTNLLSLLHFGVFLHAPDLLLLGLTIWFLPFAAVIAPGALLVTDNPVVDETNLQVPQLSFNGTAWATRRSMDNDYSYAGASADVQRCAFAAAVTGSILNIPHDSPNSSYLLDFYGPTIQCSKANDTVIEAANRTFHYLYTGSGGGMTYASWVGNDDHQIVQTTANTTSAVLSQPWQTLDEYSDDVARIFFAHDFNHSFDAIECHLYNASYSVNFTFASDQMSTAILTLAKDRPLAALTEQDSGPRSPDWMTGTIGAHISHQSVMDAFGKLFTGYAFSGSETNSLLYQTSFPLTHMSWSDAYKTQRELEELFQNITLSMFSTPTLSLNSTQATYVPVTTTTFPILYSYDAKDLWLAYGISILATLITVSFGLYSLMLNKASYSGNFSTIVRSTKMSGLHSIIPEQDDGSDPLPDYIKDTKAQIIKQDTLL